MLDILAAYDDAARILAELAAHYGYRGRFARSVHAEEGKKLALLHMKREIPHGLDIAEGFVQPVDFNNMFHNISPKP